jgi:hypothetical protein
MNDNPRILVIDIETKLIPVLTFGIRDQYLDIKQIVDIPESARGVHMVGLKWAGERKTTVLTEWEHGYEGMIRETRDYGWTMADGAVGFNHANFDMKKLDGQFALLGIDPPKPPTNIDIFKTARQMGFPSSKLDYIAQAFGIGKKVKHPGMEMWRDVLNGCPKARKRMTSIARAMSADRRGLLPPPPYIKNHPRLPGRQGDTCPNCGIGTLTSQGTKASRYFLTQSLKCNHCAAWSQGKREKIAA